MLKKNYPAVIAMTALHVYIDPSMNMWMHLYVFKNFHFDNFFVFYWIIFADVVS